MKIVTVVGARPQFIKAGVVARCIRSADGVEEIIVHTGQHYDGQMSDVFFKELQIPEPAYNLGIGSGPHGQQTGRMLEAIEKVLSAENPDWVLVYGDTNSTLAAALAAAKLHIPLAHVEAGLRSFNRRMPEEINRIVTDHLSDVLFTPTRSAVENLDREGISKSRTKLVGDVMYDAALFYGRRSEERRSILENLEVVPGNYLLATIHRAENTDEPSRLEAIFDGLARVSSRLPVIIPLHPRTRTILKAGQVRSMPEAVKIIEPVSYLEMVLLEKHARVIVTDSGGVQKEAYFHGVPCVTLRDETEWIELLESGWNRIVPPQDCQTVEAGIISVLSGTPPTLRAPLYGEGNAGELILQHLLSRAGSVV